MNMHRGITLIGWSEHRTNNWLLEELQLTRRFLAKVKKRKSLQ